MNSLTFIAAPCLGSLKVVKILVADEHRKHLSEISQKLETTPHNGILVHRMTGVTSMSLPIRALLFVA